MAIKSNSWNREQLLIAFYLYCQIPFGRMHSKNPDIIQFAVLIGRTPSALAMKLTNIASLDPAITSTGRKGLEGASNADKAMWIEMQGNWERFALESQAAVAALLLSAKEASIPVLEKEDNPEEDIDYSAINKASLVKIRIGQRFFRRSVLSAYQDRCCITGLSEPRLLVASHIVPWRVDASQRLNPSNGLCLSILHDKAFDLGMFTLTTKLKIKTSPYLQSMSINPFANEWLVKLEGKEITLPEKFKPHPEFLDWHLNNVFLAT